MSKNNTALMELIEYLEQEEKMAIYYDDIEGANNFVYVKNKVNKLLEKEKSQIIDAFDDEGHNNCGCGQCDFCAEVSDEAPINGEQYFDKTYNT